MDFKHKAANAAISAARAAAPLRVAGTLQAAVSGAAGKRAQRQPSTSLKLSSAPTPQSAARLVARPARPFVARLVEAGLPPVGSTPRACGV
jgi:hypothetical protein